MLPKSHYSLLEEWIKLLKIFQREWDLQNQNYYYQSPIWQDILFFLQEKIVPFSADFADSNEANLWQSWQTETHRYVRLLTTDLLFFDTAKQPMTKKVKHSLVSQHLESAIALSQNMIN